MPFLSGRGCPHDAYLSFQMKLGSYKAGIHRQISAACKTHLTCPEPCGEGPQWGRGLHTWVSRHFHHVTAGAHGNHWASHHGRHATCRCTLKWKLGSRARAAVAASLQMNWFLHAGNSLNRSSLIHKNHFCCFLKKSCDNANNKQIVHIFTSTSAVQQLKIFFHALALKTINTQCV